MKQKDTRQSTLTTLSYSKVCNVEDFEKLADDFAAFSLSPSAHRKSWEMVQALRALRDFGALHPGAEVLGVGAGTEPTGFILTNEVRRVHMTDIYADAGMWAATAPHQMLLDPVQCAPAGLFWQPERMIVQHMDARHLRYPDATFDGVFSSSSIEHFGGLHDVQLALAEVARVLKPRGVAAISTELAVAQSGSGGWPGVLIFDVATLLKALPPDLVLVGDIDDSISEATIGSRMDLADAIANPERLPHIVLTHAGFTFTSVSLVLRKAS